MRTLTATAAMIAVLAGPAYSQQKPPGPAQLTPQQMLDEKKRSEDAEVERQYDRMMKRAKTPEPAAKQDPWGNIRTVTPSNEKR
jgi:hypothetical protein